MQNSNRIEIIEVDKALAILEAKRASLLSEKAVIENNIETTSVRIFDNAAAKLLLTEVNHDMKMAIKSSVEHLVSYALNYIYYPGHKFEIVFETRRNQQEVDFYLEDSCRVQLKKPFVGKGGGKVMIVALVLQLALIEQFNLTSTVFLDEIGKMVDMSVIDRLAEFLKFYSEKFGKQLIYITHHTDLETVADKVICIQKVNGVSAVKA